MNDGGPAFPQDATVGNLEDWRHGMSLRDHFAGQVIASWGEDNHGVVVCVNNQRVMGLESDLAEREARTVAEAAYLIADAMLAERERAS